MAEPDLDGLSRDARVFRDNPLPYESLTEPALSVSQERYAQMFNDLDETINGERARREQGLVRPDFARRLMRSEPDDGAHPA